MKCDELKEYKAYEYGTSYVYDIGEVKEAIAELKARIQLDDDELAGFLQLEEECGGGDLRKYIAELKKKLMPCLNGDCILTCEVVEKYGKENAELKQKLEDVQASAYAESVDAGMRERRLRRALWLARAERAEARKNYWYVRCCHEGDKDLRSIDGSAVKYIGCIKRTNFDWLKVWSEVEIKCRAKAEEYK